MKEVEDYLNNELKAVEEVLTDYVRRLKKTENEYENLRLKVTFYIKNFELDKSDNFEVYTAKSFEFSEKRREVAFKVIAMNKQLDALAETKKNLAKLVVQYIDTHIALKQRIRKMFGSVDD